MADTETENPTGFVDKRRNAKGQDAGNIGGFPVAASGADISGFTSVSAMRAGLVAFNPTTFTADRLNKMTKNDMMYALRLSYEAGSI